MNVEVVGLLLVPHQQKGTEHICPYNTRSRVWSVVYTGSASPTLRFGRSEQCFNFFLLCSQT